MGKSEFEQRWEFRRNEDNDSSFDDSISSDRSLIRKQKLVTGLSSLGDDEASEISRLKHKDNENPGKSGQISAGKVKKRKTRNMRQRGKMKKDSHEESDLQKGEASADDDHAPLDDLKIFMDSLLKDLKVTRESLLKWMVDEMKKLVTDLSGKPDNHGDEKIRMQKRKKSRKVQDQSERPSTRVQNNSPEKNKQQVPIRDEEKNSKQHQNDFGYRFLNTGSTDYLNALGDRLGSGKFLELITSSNKKGDSLSVKPNLQTSDVDQNVQLQSYTNVVLAIEAQKNKCGSLKRSVKGKKTVDLGDHNQVPEDQASRGQAIRTADPGSTNVEKPGSSFVQNHLLYNPFGQAPSSMYSMLPNSLLNPINHGHDASLGNYVQPRVAETKGGMNSEPSSNQGSFPFISPEESIRRFALMGSRNMDCINQKSTQTSGIGTGFHFPIHQRFEFGLGISNPRQVNSQNLSQETSKPLGLKTNGSGATKFSSGSYNLSQHIAANNHHSLPTYKSDGRLLSYQIPNIKDGHLFRQ